MIDARVPLKKAGSNFVACCPFHTEKTPSFTVSPSKQFYHCFGCGAHGNAISFMMEYGGLGYIDAMRDLADLAGLKLPAHEPADRSVIGGRGDDQTQHDGPDLAALNADALRYYREQLKTSSRAIEYLKQRGLSGQIAARFGLGYAPEGWQNLQTVFPDYQDKALLECGLVIENDEGRRYDRFRDRIMFPIINQRGQVIGFGGRVLEGKTATDGKRPADAAGPSSPKYLNSPETPLFEKGRELYGLPQAREGIRKSDRAVVVEGYMDVIALAQYGVDNAVATLGTATTPTHIAKLLRQTNEVVFCFDGDAAGRKAAWHALEVALGCVPDGKTLRFLFLPATDDPDSFVRTQGAEAFNRLAGEAEPLSQYLVRELVRRNPIGTAEGRSKVVHEARPLLQKMVAPALQMQLVKGVAEAAQLEPEQVARLAGIGERARATPSTQSAFRTPTAPRAVKRQALALEEPEQQLLLCILASPHLGRDVPRDWIAETSPQGRALSAVLAFAEEHDATAALVIEHFRGTEHEPVIANVQGQLIGLNLAPEQFEPDFRGSLRSLERRLVKSEILRYEQKAESELTQEEREIYRDLLVADARLRQAIDLSPRSSTSML